MSRAPGILPTMLDRPRALLLTWAGVCFALCALLAVGVAAEWSWLADIDNRGESAQAWATDSDRLHDVLRLIEIAFGTIAMTVYTVVLAALLFRKHRRAAYFTVGVMLATSLTTTLLKALTDRDRPPWQSTEALLHNGAYPSGHASGIAAFGGIVIILVSMLVRRANLRRVAYVGVVLVVVLVCLDRVLLGRHYPSDVIGGVALGAGMVLLGIALYNPLPRSHAASVEPLPEVYVSARKLAVVLNPIKVEDVGQFESIVTAMATEAGWSTPTWHY